MKNQPNILLFCYLTFLMFSYLTNKQIIQVPRASNSPTSTTPLPNTGGTGTIATNPDIKVCGMSCPSYGKFNKDCTACECKKNKNGSQYDYPSQCTKCAPNYHGKDCNIFCTGSKPRNDRTLFCQSQGDKAGFSSSDCTCKCSMGFLQHDKYEPCKKLCDYKDKECQQKMKPPNCSGSNQYLTELYCQSEGDVNAVLNPDCSCKCGSGYTKTHTSSPCISTSKAVSLNILQYNVQLYGNWGGGCSLPPRKDPLDAMTKKISSFISGLNNGDIDVITFNEVWDGSEGEDVFKEKLKSGGWKYHTERIPGGTVSETIDGDATGSNSLQNSGVLIFSKWPIEKAVNGVYSDCSGHDCDAKKGVHYAKIKKNGRFFHIFASHTQADSASTIDKGAPKIRQKQFKEMLKFMNKQKIPQGEPVFFTGDFNVNTFEIPSYTQVLGKPEYDVMLSTLNAKDFDRVGNVKFTSDPKTNSWVGFDGDAAGLKCEQSYYCSICHFEGKNKGDKPCWDWCEKNGFKKATSLKVVKCKCCAQQYLDYILSHKSHKLPISGTVEAINAKVSPYTVEVHRNTGSYAWGSCEWTWMKTSDLSDHYPVLGKFLFLY